MAKKNSHITVTDQFCGAGGSSQGVHNLSKKTGGGLEVKLALNHWKLAIETHNTNFPNTQHECTDISACDPRRYPSTDILITSPECTNHSLAKGKKAVKKQMDLFTCGKADAAAERSRSTMWDVCRFAEYHQYNIIIVENVVDARKWVMFDAWLNAMYVLGYQHKCVYLNSMHMHPTPQSRDRMYIVFWKKGNKAPMLDYMPNAHCPKCNADVLAIQTWKNTSKKFGKYKQQYVYCCPVHGDIIEPYYYAAFNCIDWSDMGTRIGDRKKPLSENTVTRINYGLEKYGDKPLQIHTAYGKEARGVYRSVYEPAFTHTTVPSQAIVTPFLVDDKQTTGINFRVRSVEGTVNTLHTEPAVKLVIPFVFKTEQSSHLDQVRSINQSLQTQCTRQTVALLSPPYLVENKGQSKTKPITAPSPCLTTKPHMGIITNESWNSFINYNRSQNPSHINAPTQTIATVDQLSIVNFQKPKIEDCFYRMLKPKEVKLAMAFAADYIILGSGKDQVKQCGNAVTPPVMEWLVGQCVNSLN